MSTPNPPTPPESFLEVRLRTDSRARRSAVDRELVARVLAGAEGWPEPRRSALFAWRPLLAAAVLLLVAGALFWPGAEDASTRTPSTEPPVAVSIAPARSPDLLGRALELRKSLHAVLAAEGQGLMLDLQHVNDAIWSGLPVRSRTRPRRP